MEMVAPIRRMAVVPYMRRPCALQPTQGTTNLGVGVREVQRLGSPQRRPHQHHGPAVRVLLQEGTQVGRLVGWAQDQGGVAREQGAVGEAPAQLRGEGGER